MAKRKQQAIDEELNRLVEERLKEYEQQFIKNHTPIIETKYGQTYINFQVYDEWNLKSKIKLCNLLDLMDVEYGVSTMIIGEDNNEFYMIIKDEDKERAAFIQKFIDNGYKLAWK